MEDSEVTRYEKEKNALRQRSMASRRKDSGWKGYRLQLSKADYTKIQKLGSKLDFDIPDQKASLVDISTIVSYSLTVACKHEGLIDKNLPKVSQDRLYRQRVREVIKYRLRKEKRKADKLKLVADFMRDAGYALPVVNSRTKMKVPQDQQDSWNEFWVIALVPTLV
ncbi:hypothetical protein [Vibrio parahaemolyticus]|uniref:hypothetical protein n=1 Tax=Vibrio parahaemolyticus TaxID=670 RepID=UPI001123685C|nr:hypothetical protein [Vibrio parahaemolyticus]TOQ18273.1 hypothetical protein CGH00_23425 [Vibrio parahaemolyticus]